MASYTSIASIALAALTAVAAAQATPPLPGNGQGVGAQQAQWDDARSKATALAQQMTLAELNNVTYGAALTNGCSGQTGSAPRVGFPGICLSDGPAGAKADLLTGFASGSSVAASFNEDLAAQRGLYMGAEFRRKGAQVALGPVVGPLGRIATDGRAWEGFGADPYLSGKLAARSIEGLQQSTIASVKHYIANEQETHRMHFPGMGGLPAISSNLDDITLHELYLPPFQDAVRAGAACVMCSYNRINGVYGCENNDTLNGVLKTELNFQGFVLSDWYAQQTGVPSALAGLDMAMPNSNGMWNGDGLVRAVNSTQLPRARLEDMVVRILTAWYLTNANTTQAPGFGLPMSLLGAHELIDGRDPASKPSTRQSAVEGHVLVKNVNGALPLRKPKMLSLFGWDAHVPNVKNVPSPGSPVDKMILGFQSVNASEQTIIQGVAGNPPFPPPEAAELGVLLEGGGSGANQMSYYSDPYSAILQQAREDDTYLWWDFQSYKPLVAQSSSACLVFINQFSSEAIDRYYLHDNNSDTLVKTVADSCRNTIVVVHNAWIRVVDAWADHANVTAIVFAHLPGQDGGAALADILYGRVSPSGRLPYTLAHSEDDYGALRLAANFAANATGRDANFTEGTNIDYRAFLARDVKPRYPFGFGLTYSTFSYADIAARWTMQDPPLDPPNPAAKVPGGTASLFDVLATVNATIKNTGDVAAAEVAQLYLQPPGAGQVRGLHGFVKRLLQPGESAAVTFELTRRDLSRWNPFAQRWQLQRGTYQVAVGRDVLDLPLNTTLSL